MCVAPASLPTISEEVSGRRAIVHALYLFPSTRTPPNGLRDTSADLCVSLSAQVGYTSSRIKVWHARRCVRERLRAARGYGGPREWVLTAALGEATLSPATHCHEIGGHECDNI